MTDSIEGIVASDGRSVQLADGRTVVIDTIAGVTVQPGDRVVMAPVTDRAVKRRSTSAVRPAAVELQAVVDRVVMSDGWQPGRRYTCQELVNLASRVREALVDAGATHLDIQRLLSDWIHLIDSTDQGATERRAALTSIAAGFGYTVSFRFTPLDEARS
jgi:hypothetical protein